MITLPDDIAKKIAIKLEEEYDGIGDFGPWDDPTFDHVSTEDLISFIQGIINENLVR